MRVHAAVGRALEEAGGNLDERAAEIAQHYEEAGDGAAAARWHRRAAQWAGLSDPREGLRHWRRVRELAPGVEDVSERSELTLQACHQLLSLGWRMGGSEAEAAAVYEEGRALAERTGDRRALAMLVGLYGIVRMSVGRLCARLRSLRRGGRTDRGGVRRSGTARGAWDVPSLWTPPRRRWPGGAGVVGAGPGGGWIGQCARQGDRRLQPESWRMFMVRALALMYLGRLEEAWSQVREAERVAEESRELEVLGWVQMRLGGPGLHVRWHRVCPGARPS